MENDKPITLLLADDHHLFRAGLISLLNDESNILVVGEVESGKELIKKYFELHPDIILLDISMPGLSGTMALKEIRRRDPKAKALFLSMYEGEEYIFYCMKLGGRGLVNKNIMRGELIYAIKQVYEGQRYFGQNYGENKLEELAVKFEDIAATHIDEYTRISPKERDILVHIAEGITSNEIAKRLGLSKRTIDTHRANLMDKLKLKTLPELIAYAIKFTMANKIISEGS
ncbi:MAG: response regulator transcription factor [Bacteroidetes bacterium]|nr:response regulator transcription factor [Bacteroidota bacterium]